MDNKLGFFFRFQLFGLSCVFFIIILQSFRGIESNNNIVRGSSKKFEKTVKDAIAKSKKELKQLDHEATVRGVQSRRSHYVKSTLDTEAIGKSSNIFLKSYQNLLQLNSTEEERRNVTALLYKLRPRVCKRKVKCESGAKFRTMDGTCNNREHPLWGASFTEFDRLLTNAYEDGFNEPRGGRISRLPNVRTISTTIHPDLIKPDPILTNMVGQFGQFVDHDLTLTPEGDKSCCSSSNDVDCLPIRFENDTFYSSRIVPQTCLDFTRSTPYCFPTRKHNATREQMNVLTAYADTSNVYGSDYKRAKQLREGRGGRLRVNKENRLLLPTVEQVEQETNQKIMFMGTFLAGDARVNEMPALAVLHTLFVREHNRIAEQIVTISRGKGKRWNDEKIFQETRRIVIAQWQNILFGEYLPLILALVGAENEMGEDTMNSYNLSISRKSKYDPTVNPTMFHAFSTAAYRFGHSLINGIIRLLKNLVPVGSYQLRNNYFKPDQILNNNGDGYNRILEGLVNQPAQKYDDFVTEDLTNFLLRSDQNDFGSDLIARNLHRGRDHGLRAYNDYRVLCNFSSLPDTFDNEPLNGPRFTNGTWNKFATLYQNPKDIDLFTGGLTELPLPGAVTGPTFNCLKAKQFHRIKFGDRFFFTHASGRRDKAPWEFSTKQVSHIKKRKFSDIICDNSNLIFVPIDVFRMTVSNNTRMPCDAGSSKRNILNVDLLISKH